MSLSGRRNLRLESASHEVPAETRQTRLNESDCKRITLGLVQSQDFEYDSSTLESSIRIRRRGSSVHDRNVSDTQYKKAQRSPSTSQSTTITE